MTESEIIELVSRFLPEGYRLETMSDGTIHLMSDSICSYPMAICIWHSREEFLFGRKIQDSGSEFFSFFDWLARGVNWFTGETIRDIIAVRPELLGLAGCSSVEEIELKMTVAGMLDGSRKTLGRKER